MGDQRGSDTLVVPLITSNDGLSIAFIHNKLQISSAYKIYLAWARDSITLAYSIFSYGLDGRFIYLYFLRVSIMLFFET